MKESLVKQAARIAGNFLQEEVKTSYQIEGKGITNQVCVVETEINKVVVRMNVKDEYQSFIKEKWCIEQAAEVGVPGPKVMSIGIVDETAYMIQGFIEGVNGGDSTVQKSIIWRRLGEYAKLIDSIQVKVRNSVYIRCYTSFNKITNYSIIYGFIFFDCILSKRSKGSLAT